LPDPFLKINFIEISEACENLGIPNKNAKPVEIAWSGAANNY
jgi:hypothetical protein